ncbi:MAG: hypothetical protein IJC76_00640 [Lachnospiraceae bacterium]|nr:hypothetical protein [Lachnospiraceae bacterium]
MSTSRIGKAIKESCADDKEMQGLLMDLLDFNLTGRQWYKEEYTKIIEKYAKEMEGQHED